MSDKKQLSQMSQFSIIREIPGDSRLQTIRRVQRPSELKFKIEPIGIQPEDDDDLETCPSRTRSNWPHKIEPWWKPTDKFEKPPYSYATLIAHAILTSKDGRLTLSDIYKWISEMYPYYKLGQKGWQNSIRHNLSLNRKWFIKVDRRPTQAHPGKGGYWTLQVDMEEVFVDNLCRAGGHSRRHPEMNMYSIYPHRSSIEPTLQLNESISPNIHITRPEDFELKKIKNTIPAPRIRNMGSQEKKSLSEIPFIPNTEGKQLTIRFTSNSIEPNLSQKRRKSSSSRPAPKKGKKLNLREPGSSTIEDEDDSGVDIDSFDSIYFKKQKFDNNHNLKPSDLMNSMLEDENNDLTGLLNLSHDFWSTQPQPSDMLLVSEYPTTTFDIQAQNILQALTTELNPTEPKTIDLQSFSLEKSLHYPEDFSVDQFLDPNDKLFVQDYNGYNLDQYVDFSSTINDPINFDMDIMWPKEEPFEF